MLKEEISCPLCEQHINKYGDHATCCTRGGSLINRHNMIRDLVDKIASDGMLSPIPEKKGILGPTSGRRPGDVTIPRWSEGKGLAIDVAITCPLLSSVNEGKPCEAYASNVKHAKYDTSFVGTEYMFCAMVWETLGAIHEEGEEVIKQIFRFAAKRLGHEFSSFCGRSWARVSCCLQRSVAQSILTRTDGIEFRDTSFKSSLPNDFSAPELPDADPAAPPLNQTSEPAASRAKQEKKGKSKANHGKGSFDTHPPSSVSTESVLPVST